MPAHGAHSRLTVHVANCVAFGGLTSVGTSSTAYAILATPRNTMILNTVVIIFLFMIFIMIKIKKGTGFNIINYQQYGCSLLYLFQEILYEKM